VVNPENVIDVTRLIQLAVAPVFLLTAVGTIIGVLSNRLGRAVDRSRTLEERLRQLQPEGQKAVRAELGILDRRVRLVYGAIVLAVLCALFVGLLIAIAFVDAFVDIDLSKFIGLLFIAAMLAFILALMVFLREIYLAVTSTRNRMR
jgi:MFS family permease